MLLQGASWQKGKFSKVENWKLIILYNYPSIEQTHVRSGLMGWTLSCVPFFCILCTVYMYIGLPVDTLAGQWRNNHHPNTSVNRPMTKYYSYIFKNYEKLQHLQTLLCEDSAQWPSIYNDGSGWHVVLMGGMLWAWAHGYLSAYGRFGCTTFFSCAVYSQQCYCDNNNYSGTTGTLKQVDKLDALHRWLQSSRGGQYSVQKNCNTYNIYFASYCMISVTSSSVLYVPVWVFTQL